VTHGICEDCSRTLLEGDGRTLREFLDSLEEPVIVVDAERVVVGVNEPARSRLGRRVGENQRLLAGELIECRFAGLPGGCGNTPQCPGCSIRSAIAETHRTGHGVERVATAQKTIRGEIRLVVSTEKMGDLVLMRIDEAEPTGGK
jgi:hypothetical protein